MEDKTKAKIAFSVAGVSFLAGLWFLWMALNPPSAFGHEPPTDADRGTLAYNISINQDGKLYVCGMPTTWEAWEELVGKINRLRKEHNYGGQTNPRKKETEAAVGEHHTDSGADETDAPNDRHRPGEKDEAVQTVHL